MARPIISVGMAHAHSLRANMAGRPGRRDTWIVVWFPDGWGLAPARPFLLIAARAHGKRHRRIGGKADRVAGGQTQQLGAIGPDMALMRDQFGKQPGDLGDTLILTAADADQR